MLPAPVRYTAALRGNCARSMSAKMIVSSCRINSARTVSRLSAPSSCQTAEDGRVGEGEGAACVLRFFAGLAAADIRDASKPPYSATAPREDGDAV